MGRLPPAAFVLLVLPALLVLLILPGLAPSLPCSFNSSDTSTPAIAKEGGLGGSFDGGGVPLG